VLLELAWIVAQHRRDRSERVQRLAWRNPAATATTNRDA
jgi:hypothetical protein